MVLLVHRLPGIPGIFRRRRSIALCRGDGRRFGCFGALGICLLHTRLAQPALDPDYFSDPVLSTFVKRKDADLAATLIHEMAHQVVYVKNDTSFNESFATFVEEEGLEQFFQERIGSGSSEMIWYRSARRDRERFRQLVLDAYCLLYTSPSPRDLARSRMPSSA